MRGWVLVGYRVAAVALVIGWSIHGESPAVVEAPGVLRTSPHCDDIVGYSGPTDCEIVLDAAGRIASLRVVRSGDTVEHVAAVRRDPDFLAAFVGRSAAEPAALATVDAVSRATLTSAAIIESVVKRLSGARPSLRFPAPLTLAEVRRFLPAAAQLEPVDPPVRWRLRDTAGAVLGFALRTGPGNEAVVGYQGPTDTLLVTDAEAVIRGLVVRRSYDNEKYVDYVRGEPGFADQFRGRHLRTIADLLGPAGTDRSATFDAHATIDGVSGATMTSHAVAEGIVRTAAAALAPPAAPPAAGRRLRVTGRDVGTLIAIALALLWTFASWRGHRVLRLVSRVAVVGYLGVVSGALLSQALLVGWVGHGLPWRVAPGLVVLAVVALLVPVITGRQPYCHQLCAHGAVQHLLRRTPWSRPVPAGASRALRCLPGVLLAVVAGAMVTGSSGLPVATLEPFGAWALPLAGVATCVLAAGSLVLAAIYPMAYCRFGCPTGRLLEFLRRRGARDRFGAADAIAAVLLVVAWFAGPGGR